MFSAGFEPGIPEIERLQTYALDRTVTGYSTRNTYCVRKVMPPYYYLHIQMNYLNATQHKTQLNIRAFFLYLTFPRSFGQKAARAETGFRTRRCRILHAFLETISLSSFKFITRPINSIVMFVRNTNNQKSDGAKTGLQGGCGTTSNLIRPLQAQVAALVLVLP